MIRTFWLTCIFLCGAFSISFCQTDRISDLIKRKEFTAAALECEYSFFKSEDLHERNLFLIKKAYCLRQAGDHRQALEALDRVVFSALEDSLAGIVHSDLALTNYYLQDYSRAESHIIRIESIDSTFKYTPDAELLYVFVLNELTKWNEAETRLGKFIHRNFSEPVRDSLLAATRVLYDPSAHPKLKNLRKAQLLSSFLPGVGQMYAGYFWDGVTNAALVSASLGFTVYSVLTANYIAAALIGYGMMSKFYIGGQTHLEYLCGQTNYKRTKEYNDNLRVSIIETIERSRP